MKLPEEVKKLIEEKNFAHIATLMKDGSPQVTTVWVDHDGDHILVNTAEGRVKLKNLKRDPRVALSITDASNNYSGVWIRGRVVKITTEGAEE
ncbi:MAG: PPOX class F420-dependent oxidoreductase [Candidatus Micrarchaeales archaeon]